MNTPRPPLAALAVGLLACGTNAPLAPTTVPDTEDATDTARATEDAPPPIGADTTGDAVDAVDVGPDVDAGEPAPTCAPGSALGPDGACRAIGIQGCVDLFVDEETGLCEPTSAHCPDGTIPRFDTGCVPVGVPDCAAELVGEDGLCRPRFELCPAGTIPAFETGCVPVGVDGCAADWVDDAGVCRPSQAACPAGTLAVPTEGCVPLDGPEGCGEPPWGHVEAAADTVYVDPTAPAGGDGTSSSPYRSLTAAVADAPEGGRIVLAAGTYDAGLSLTRSVDLVGRCASLVRLTGTVPTPHGFASAVVAVDAGAVSLHGMTIEALGAAVFAANTALDLERVHTLWTKSAAIDLEGSATVATLHHVLIQEGASHGIAVREDAQVAVTASALAGNRGANLYAFDATAALADVFVEGPVSPWDLGRSIDVRWGASVTATDTVVSGATQAAVHAQDEGSSVTLVRAVVADTLPLKDGWQGWGVVGFEGTTLALEDTVVTHNHDFGVMAQLATAALSGTLVAHTQPRVADEGGGVGVYADSSQVAIADSAVVGNHQLGAAAEDPISHLSLDRTLVQGTKAEVMDGTLGIGAYGGNDASLTVTRCALVDNAAAGVALIGDAELLLTDSLLTGTRMAEPGHAHGLLLAAGAHATSSGNAILGNEYLGVAAYASGTVLESTGDLIADTTAPPGYETLGFGVIAGQSSTVKLEGAAIVRNQTVALYGEQFSHVELSGSLVADTLPDAAEGGGGRGLGFHGQYALVTGTAIVDNHEVGLQFAGPVLLGELTDSLVARTKPRANDGVAGGGVIVILSGTDARVTRTVLRDNAFAAVSVFQAELTLVDSDLLNTQAGDAAGFTGLGDGLMAALSQVEVSGVNATGSARAGLLFQDCTGSVAAVQSTANAYGLVVQGEEQPSFSDDVVAEGNATDTLQDGALDVPDNPTAVPEDHNDD